jgi:hypothetical protein
MLHPVVWLMVAVYFPKKIVNTKQLLPFSLYLLSFAMWGQVAEFCLH